MSPEAIIVREEPVAAGPIRRFVYERRADGTWTRETQLWRQATDGWWTQTTETVANVAVSTPDGGAE